MSRVFAWIAIACAALAISGVFLPALDVRAEGVRVKRASLSLYRATRDREAARVLLGRYARWGGKHYGEAAADAALKHAKAGASRLHVDDARDAMSTLDELSDDDAREAGLAIAAVTWGFFALEAIVLALVFGDTMRGAYRRWRAHVAAALALVGAAVGVAVLVGAREAAWQANDALGAGALEAGTGAYVIAIGAVGALAGAVALSVQLWRAKRDAERA